MLKIRLTRIGKKGQPQYRIVLAEQRSKRDSKFIDQLGVYTPLGKEVQFTLDRTKYNDWLKRGAQPSETIRKLAARPITTKA